MSPALTAPALSRRYAAPLAYICGPLGVLFGADLSSLDKLRGLGAPGASIGGAGTFDGVFLTGIVAALLRGWASGRGEAPARRGGAVEIGNWELRTYGCAAANR